MGNQSYRYIKRNSIIGSKPDEYELTMEEFNKIYSFYVTYSMCGTQSERKRSFCDYGWKSDVIRGTSLGKALSAVINLNNNSNFIFSEENNLKEQFFKHDLKDGELINVEYERAVLAHTRGENKYLKLFYRIRDGFAHGRFKLRLSSRREKMIVIQDNDNNNVTARIVIKLETLMQFISAVDQNHII